MLENSSILIIGGTGPFGYAFVPMTLKKYNPKRLVILSRVIAPDAKQEIVGIRPGEKLHEQMFGAEDSYHTYEYPEHFKILPQINGWADDQKHIKDGAEVPEGFVYSSDTNPEWMSDAELRAWIEENADFIGKI